MNDSNRNFTLLQRLTKNSISVARDSGFDLLHYNEEKQTGSGFGSRLSAAIQSVFDQGYEKVIVIGSDCPDIRSQDLSKIEMLLERGRMVLGPDYRGGVYAIGLTRQCFDTSLFRTLPWQSGQLRLALVDYAVQVSSSIIWLTKKADLNHHLDIRGLWHFSHGLRAMIESLTSVRIRFPEAQRKIYLPSLTPEIGRRGP